VAFIAEEYHARLGKADFTLTRVVPTTTAVSVVEAAVAAIGSIHSIHWIHGFNHPSHGRAHVLLLHVSSGLARGT
jgi:hypothetical protein